MKRAVRENFEASVEAYDAYERRTGRFSTLARRLGEEMRRLRGGGFDRLLDAGAGTGAGATALEPVARDVLALDASRAMLAENPATTRLVGDIDRLPFGAGSVDAVAFTASLFLVPEPAVAAREARRVLQPRGVAGAVVPVGWMTPDDRDAFAHLPRDSRQPHGPAAVEAALAAAFDDLSRDDEGGSAVSGGEWVFETTSANVRAFHTSPAGAARVYPDLPPGERVAAVRDLLTDLPDTLEHRWRWFVATA